MTIFAAPLAAALPLAKLVESRDPQRKVTTDRREGCIGCARVCRPPSFSVQAKEMCPSSGGNRMRPGGKGKEEKGTDILLFSPLTVTSAPFCIFSGVSAAHFLPKKEEG